jgi:hypothetical protein
MYYVPSVSNKQKTWGGEKLPFFVGILTVTEEKSRIRIRNPVVRIRGSGSKPHGSGTLISGFELKLLLSINCFDKNQEELLEGKDPDRKSESANLHLYLTFRRKIVSN